MNTHGKMVYMQKILNPSQYRSNDFTLNKENFSRMMIDSINKALNTNEAPVKEKHVRRLVIGTYQASSGAFFWQNISISRLKENPLICWKFCHVMHKLLRDGHNSIVKISHDRSDVLRDCAYINRYNQEGYGPLIFKYCNLLFNRIVWLKLHPEIPNDMKISDQLLGEIVAPEPDIWFDFCCELFDRLEELLDLQDEVLKIVEDRKYNSMTNIGQCHLAPLIACIQDSSLLYDYSVKALFKCYSIIDLDLLDGHIQRFNKLHKWLRKIYCDASNLQYFKTLIQIPHLPEKPPNFEIASNLERHIAPKVIMISNSVERESPDQVLVDLGDTYPGAEELNLPVSRPESSTGTATRDSVDALFEQAGDPFQASASVLSLELEKSIERINSEHEKTVKELSETIELLKADLEAEKREHAKTKLDKDKLQREASNLRHQLIAAANDYGRLKEECTRAKYENEISNDAMKKLMKNMSELRSQQQHNQQEQQQEQEFKTHQENMRRQQAEVDKREEDLLAAEMNNAERMIKEAARKIEELGEKSRQLENGTKLQVNEKIAEVCTNLMVAVKNLIAQSRVLQREIVNAEGGRVNNDEFYKRNSEWTNGLISAAQEVAMAAKALVDVADRSMSGVARFTELAAAAHAIAAATTSLVVSSRVKAHKDSDKLKNFLVAARQVNQCTTNVVKASEVCANLIGQQDNEVDISSLSLHQTKQKEIEAQVKILELEAELNQERRKLGLLRRQHYEQEEAQEVSASGAAGDDRCSTSVAES